MPRSPKCCDRKWFADNVKKMKFESSDGYLSSYPVLLRAFGRLNPAKNTEDLALAAHAVFGWMPTIINFKWDKGESAREALEKLLNGSDNEEANIGTLCGCIRTSRGQSIVAVSKFLHFLMPKHWPIWDNKKVGRFWSLGANADRKVERYVEYTRAMREYADDSDVPDKVNVRLRKMNYDYDVTPIRALEMVMFYQPRR